MIYSIFLTAVHLQSDGYFPFSPMINSVMEPIKVKTLWISDIHLGAKACNPDMALKFLSRINPDTIYLVGDIIDGWALKRRFWFPKSHMRVVNKITKLARTKHIVWIRGNHDSFLDDYIPIMIGGIETIKEKIHITADGKKLLVTHGDEFDNVVRYAKWLAWTGDLAYTFLVFSNQYLNKVRSFLGLEYWSISAYMKKKVKIASIFIHNFEMAVVKSVKERGLDGIVCGHIHVPEIKMIDGILYANDGDVCETCSAIVEYEDGSLSIIYAKDL